MRTTLVGSLVANVALQPQSQARRGSACSRWGASSCATRGRRTAISRWPGSGSPCGSARSPSGRRSRSSGACGERPVDFFDVKGDVEALFAPRQARFVEGCPPGAAPRPLRPGRSRRGRGRLDRGAAPPAGSRNTSLPAAAVVFELDAEPLLQRFATPPDRGFPLPGGHPGPRGGGGRGGAGPGTAGRAVGGPTRVGAGGPSCSTFTVGKV